MPGSAATRRTGSEEDRQAPFQEEGHAFREQAHQEEVSAAHAAVPHGRRLSASPTGLGETVSLLSGIPQPNGGYRFTAYSKWWLAHLIWCLDSKTDLWWPAFRRN